MVYKTKLMVGVPSIFTRQGPPHNQLTKVGLKDARDVRLLLSDNQSEKFFLIRFQWVYNLTKSMFYIRSESSSVIGSI